MISNLLLFIELLYLLYFLLFLVYGLHQCVSNRPSDGVRGRELLSGREGKGEIISLNVAFKGGS